MNNKDLEAFEKWLEIEFGEEVDKSRSWLYEKSIFIFACEYKDKECSNIMDAMTRTSQYNSRLQAENKKLREALQSIGYFHLRPEQVIRTAREALKEIKE